MKKIQVLAVIGLVLALGSVARAESAAKPAAVTVVAVTGEARYSTDGSTWHPLVAGKVLHEGAVIETAEGSSADLVLSGTPIAVPATSSAPMSQAMIGQASDPNVRGFAAYKPIAQQNVIRMSGGTMLAVDKLTQMNTGADTVGDTELDLRAGNIFLNVKKLSADSQFIVKLPNGVAGIRGAWGSIGADDSVNWGGGVVIISIIGLDGKPHVFKIDGGFGYNPHTGQVANLTAAIIQALKLLSSQTTTVVIQVVQVARNELLIYISPTQGTTGQ